VGASDFAHLHLHTQYSLLDGAIRMKDLCSIVRDRGMRSVAVTDHGNMFGTLQLHREARRWGIKPIYGCEVYVSEGPMEARTDRKSYHLVLLAENEAGFHNLQRLVSFGYLRGFYYTPRVDRDALREHSEGLIGLSACLSGHIAKLVLADDMDQARERVLEYRSIFAPGRYFLELQANGLLEQERVNAALAQLAQDCDVPTVGTNDCHYVDRDEAFAHEVLMCIQQGRTMDDPNRIRHTTDELFIKTPDELEAYFRAYPGAMENACRIAKTCNVELELGEPELPDFRLPDDVEDDLPGYLRRLARDGLARRLSQMRARGVEPDESVYQERLERELKIIIEMKYPGYFLIVWDFIRQARADGIPVGPGRGSGAGSLVAYSLRITNLDPIRHKLLFERFLNPERVTMPDFDVDFCMDRRDEVIRYVTERYGDDRVGQIATFHTLKARGLVRDVCRALGRSVAEANDLAKLVPEGPSVTLSRAMTDPEPLKREARRSPELHRKHADTIAVAERASRLRERAREDERAAEVLRIGQSLEGLNRHVGMHAAGIVIGSRALWEHVPCFRADGRMVTQYTMTDAEKAGLVKFDFLGLKTLTVICNCVRMVNERGLSETPLDIDAIPMDDHAVYDMIAQGDTTGVFQLESAGFRDLLKRLRPDRFEDIVAANALYRPGPLEGGMVDQFIDCKHGRTAIEYPHPMLEDVLRETYGVFAYQEQVIQAAQVLAGYSLGAADVLRKAMGKKIKAEMDGQRIRFVEGCRDHSDISRQKATEIFELIDKFAGYGFPKAHSAAYGLITYQTAYLKHHFPVAFMAALMTCDKDKNEKVVRFIAEARQMGIDVLSPDVNDSERDFTVVERRASGEEGDGRPRQHQIRFGLGAVRNVGGTAVDAILEAREDGPFDSLFDLCRRADLRRVNKRTLEGLICAGALDGVCGGRDRATLRAALDPAVEQGQGAQRDRASGQRGLFDALGAAQTVYREDYPTVEEWTPKELLRNEREALGFYLTGHPLDRFRHDIERFATATIGELDGSRGGSEVVLGGVICDLREVQTRSGRGPMAFFDLEDQSGRIETVAFARIYGQRADEDENSPTIGELLEQAGDEPVLVGGRLEVDRNDDGEVQGFKLLMDSVREVAEVREEKTRGVRLRLQDDQLTAEKIRALQQIVLEHAGSCSLELQVTVPDRYTSTIFLGDEFGVTPHEPLLFALERLFGKGSATLV